MSVIRVEKSKDYTIMSNYHFKEKEMSLKAKGLLSLMLSLPDDWDYTITGLAKICKENESAIKTGLDELKQYGYLKVLKNVPSQENGGRINYEYVVYEKPIQEGKKQGIENLGVEIQGVENQGQLNTNILNTNNKILNINNNRFKKPSLEEIKSYIQEKDLKVDADYFYDYFETGNWKDSKGNNVKNWKQKLLTWNRYSANNTQKTTKQRVYEALYETNTLGDLKDLYDN